MRKKCVNCNKFADFEIVQSRHLSGIKFVVEQTIYQCSECGYEEEVLDDVEDEYNCDVCHDTGDGVAPCPICMKK